MAIINCPECGKEISSQANACPNCGYPIKENTNKNKNVKRVKMILSVITTLIILGCIVALSVNSNINNKIVGKWYKVDKNIVYIFNKDGTGSIKSYEENTLSGSFEWKKKNIKTISMAVRYNGFWGIQTNSQLTLSLSKNNGKLILKRNSNDSDNAFCLVKDE